MVDRALRDAMLAALALQADWGADEALTVAPIDRAVPPALPPSAAPSLHAPTTPRATRSLPGPPAIPGANAAALAASADTLDALRAAIAGFAHPLRDTATALCLGDGFAATPRLMLIGDAPGAEEDRAGRPWVGPPGRLLDRMLASIGLSRERDCYLCDVLPWRPPGDRPPSAAELAAFLPFLHRHVGLVAPARLVLLGANAARAVLGTTEPLSRLRNRCLQVTAEEGQTWPASAMHHPLALLRSPLLKRDAWHDLLALRRVLDAAEPA